MSARHRHKWEVVGRPWGWPRRFWCVECGALKTVYASGRRVYRRPAIITRTLAMWDLGRKA